MDASRTLSRFSELRALVLGDAILDTFILGTATRLCRERPVPVVRKRDEHDHPGGAANVAANLRALGAEVRLVAATGADAAGARLRALLTRAGISDAWLLSVPGGRTARKTRVIADDHYVGRIDEEADGADAREAQTELAERLGAAFDGCDLAIVSDYDAGVASAPVLRRLCGLRRRNAIPLVVDAKRLARYARMRADVLTPNLDEAAELMGLSSPPDADDVAALRRLGEGLLRRCAAEAVAITLGAHGVFIAVRDGTFRLIDGRRVTSRNTVGAGDSFTAALALSLAVDRSDLRRAARIGLEAAAVAVAKPYTATVSLAELTERLDLLGAAAATPTVEDAARARGSETELEALAARLEERRRRGERIVLTNGVFDILHEGHVRLLERARALGDVLVVALNSDASAAAIKGPQRPINDQAHRRAVLEALSSVDHVIVFDELTAEHIVERLAPAVYARGDDRRLEDLPEAAAAARLGARVVLLPRLSEMTTSRIIDRVTARSPYWAPVERYDGPSPAAIVAGGVDLRPSR